MLGHYVNSLPAKSAIKRRGSRDRYQFFSDDENETIITMLKDGNQCNTIRKVIEELRYPHAPPDKKKLNKRCVYLRKQIRKENASV